LRARRYIHEQSERKMGNKSSSKLSKEIFQMLDEDGSQTINWGELQKLTLCTPLARRLEKLSLKQKIKIEWDREKLIRFVTHELKVNEKELEMVHVILKLKGLPSRIFQILDKNGNGVVYGEEFRAYLESAKTDLPWIQQKIDQTLAAIIQFAEGREGNLLTAPGLAKCLITGGFDKNQMQALCDHLKENMGTKDLEAPKIKDHGLKSEDLCVDFNCDIRDIMGQWCTGTIIEKKKSRVKVAYDGFSDKFNEWIDSKKDFLRFAPMFKYTSQGSGFVLDYHRGQKVMAWLPSPPPKRWRRAEIAGFQDNQICLHYKVMGTKYQYWVHGSLPELKASKKKIEGEAMSRTKDGKWFVGQIVEVLDTVGKWEPAEVLRIQGRSIYVHYVNWSSRWDEWLNIDANLHRLRSLGAAIMESQEERLSREQREEFYKGLRKNYGYEVLEIPGDGNCLFRTFAHQIYNDQEKHMDVRKECCDYLEKEQSTFAVFIPEDLKTYVGKMRTKNQWGGHVEIAVMRELYNVNVEIYEKENILEPRPIGAAAAKLPVVKLAYEGKRHYNSIVDPKRDFPFGNGKDREVNLRKLRLSREGKETKVKEPAPKPIVRKYSKDTLMMKKDDPASNLNEYDMQRAIQDFMDMTTFAVPLEKVAPMVKSILEKLFLKKKAAYKEHEESLEKLKSDMFFSNTIKEFVDALTRSNEIKDGGIQGHGLIQQFQENLLPTVMYAAPYGFRLQFASIGLKYIYICCTGGEFASVSIISLQERTMVRKAGKETVRDQRRRLFPLRRSLETQNPLRRIRKVITQKPLRKIRKVILRQSRNPWNH